MNRRWDPKVLRGTPRRHPYKKRELRWRGKNLELEPILAIILPETMDAMRRAFEDWWINEPHGYTLTMDDEEPAK